MLCRRLLHNNYIVTQLRVEFVDETIDAHAHEVADGGRQLCDDGWKYEYFSEAMPFPPLTRLIFGTRDVVLTVQALAIVNCRVCVDSRQPVL